MLMLIWVTLIFALRRNGADAAALKHEDVSAEAGLCVEIPCNLTSDTGLTLESAAWYKCNLSAETCADSDLIFQWNNSTNVQPAFRGRVSLLEPVLSQRTCGIIINDLTKSDSGTYQLRVLNDTTGPSVHTVTVSVKDLIQKPKVETSQLIEGQQTTLTCTAPGSCSGSGPNITWVLTGAGDKDSHITGTITANQGRSSSLTLNSSVIDRGTKITCKVGLSGHVTTETTLTLNKTYVKKPEITGNKTVDQGETLVLTCSVDSLPPSDITWTKPGWSRSLDLQYGPGLATLIIPNVTAEHSGEYICTAKHVSRSVTESVNVTVKDVRKLRKLDITGQTTINKGDALNLTCSLDGLPQSVVTWTKHGFETVLQNGTGAATLNILNVTEEDSGQYICTAKHLAKPLTERVNVTVMLYPKILNVSGCIRRHEVLTCVCISQGVPLPTIRWLLLKNHTDYSVVTAVSAHRVKSTVTVKDLSSTLVECVSSSKHGDVLASLVINQAEQKEEGQMPELIRFVTQLEVIFAFLVGALIGGIFAAIICCLARKYHRQKQKSSGHAAEALEMVTSHRDPLIDADQSADDDQAIYQEAAEAGEAAAATETDVDYSKLDFSHIKRKGPAEAEKTEEVTETEYAEIKKEKAEERQDAEAKEEEEMMEGDEGEDAKHSVQDETETEGEDVALYSSVKDLTG